MISPLLHRARGHTCCVSAAPGTGRAAVAELTVTLVPDALRGVSRRGGALHGGVPRRVADRLRPMRLMRPGPALVGVARASVVLPDTSHRTLSPHVTGAPAGHCANSPPTCAKRTAGSSASTAEHCAASSPSRPELNPANPCGRSAGGRAGTKKCRTGGPGDGRNLTAARGGSSAVRTPWSRRSGSSARRSEHAAGSCRASPSTRCADHRCRRSRRGAP